jgi:hypothetical protein
VELDPALTFLEKTRIGLVLDAADPKQFAVWRLSMSSGDSSDGRARLVFPVGFALATGQQIIYFRIQNHLRKMGLGRDALALLIERKIVTEEFAPPAEAPDGHLWTRENRARFHGLFRSAQRLAGERSGTRAAGAS